MKLPSSIQKLADILSDLPSIGPRQGIRLALHLTGEVQKVSELVRELENLKNVKRCERCFFIHQGEKGICETCADPNRDQRLIFVLEKDTDLLSVENTGKYRGRYFIIGQLPKTGLLEGWQKARLETLKNFIQKELEGEAKEIILGMNPTATGDLQASLLLRELSSLAKKISRLGRGLPTGGEIEFADEDTLSSALERRS